MTQQPGLPNLGNFSALIDQMSKAAEAMAEQMTNAFNEMMEDPRVHEAQKNLEDLLNNAHSAGTAMGQEISKDPVAALERVLGGSLPPGVQVQQIDRGGMKGVAISSGGMFTPQGFKPIQPGQGLGAALGGAAATAPAAQPAPAGAPGLGASAMAIPQEARDAAQQFMRDYIEFCKGLAQRITEQMKPPQ